MEGKDIYILLMLTLLCWPRLVASLATPRRLTGDALACLISDALSLLDDSLLALLGWQPKRGLLTTLQCFSLTKPTGECGLRTTSSLKTP